MTSTFAFADGSTVDLNLGPDLEVLGKDADGYVVVRWAPAGIAEPMTYGLTDCCHASGKGLMDDETGDGYVGCRSCYAEVDPKLGGPADPVTNPVVTAPPACRWCGTPLPCRKHPDETSPTTDPGAASAASAAPPRRNTMSNTQSQPALAQFEAMGIPESDFTDAMRLAVKQKWSNLPVDDKVDDLRDRLAAVETPVTPTAEILQAQGFDGDADTEAKRLKRNAKVQAWRARNQLQAALDARSLAFAARRAGKKSNAA